MKNVELVRFANETELVAAAAAEWGEAIEALAGAQKPILAALSGGRIARPFFSALAGQFRSRNLPQHLLHFFWADERCVPPDDAESNFLIAREALFEPLQFAPEQIHRVNGEDAPGLAARKAETDLRRIAAANADGQPILDLIFLGVGEDGHVASLFPGEIEQAMTNQAVYRAVVGPKPPPNRVTLGYSTLAAGRRVWVLVSGTAKEQALRDSLDPDGRTPLARVLEMRPATRILTDIPL